MMGLNKMHTNLKNIIQEQKKISKVLAVKHSRREHNLTNYKKLIYHIHPNKKHFII